MNGNGGWAAIVATPIYGIELAGCEEKTTNNRMELLAAIKGLSILHEPHIVSLVSDSAYMLNTIKNEWYYRWFYEESKGITKRNGSPRPNMDLWRDIEKLLCYHVVKPIKVKGHSGVAHNERVDKLAVAARQGQHETFEVIYGNVTV